MTDWKQAKRNADAAKVRKHAAADKRKRPPRTPPTVEQLLDIVSRSRTTEELKLLWRNAKEMGLLTDDARQAMVARAKDIEAQHV